MRRTIRCPNCSARHALYQTEAHFPWYLAPLRLLLESVKCDACLHKFYRVRPTRFLIPRNRGEGIPPVFPFP